MAKPNRTYILSSLNNALKLLDILSVRDNIGLSEISRLAKLDKTSVFKMLYTLEYRGYVIKTSEAHYRLGIKFTDYGNLVQERCTMSDLADERMRYLSDTTGETVALGALGSTGKVIIANLVENAKTGSIPSRVGYEMDSHCNANGKLLLAYLPETRARSLISTMPLTPRTPFTITNRAQLYRQIEALRGASYAEQCEEYRLGQCDISAPVFDHNGTCRWSLSVLCSREHFGVNHDFLVSSLVACAQGLSRRMGYSDELDKSVIIAEDTEEMRA